MLHLVGLVVLAADAVQFLHVGKTAGATVELVLNALRSPSGNRCLGQVMAVHMWRPQINNGSPRKIVMSVRDPLSTFKGRVGIQLQAPNQRGSIHS